MNKMVKEISKQMFSFKDVRGQKCLPCLFLHISHGEIMSLWKFKEHIKNGVLMLFMK